MDKTINDISFSQDELRQLKTMANQAWQTVSQDIPIASYSPEEVFEIATDADRMRGFTNSLEQIKLVDKFYNLGLLAMLKYVPIFFPANSYE